MVLWCLGPIWLSRGWLVERVRGCEGDPSKAAGMGVIAALASLGKRIGCLAGGETIERGILDARVTHIRHAERRYVLSHRLSYLHIELATSVAFPGLGSVTTVARSP